MSSRKGLWTSVGWAHAVLGAHQLQWLLVQTRDVPGPGSSLSWHWTYFRSGYSHKPGVLLAQRFGNIAFYDKHLHPLQWHSHILTDCYLDFHFDKLLYWKSVFPTRICKGRDLSALLIALSPALRIEPGHRESTKYLLKELPVTSDKPNVRQTANFTGQAINIGNITSWLSLRELNWQGFVWMDLWVMIDVIKCCWEAQK